MNRLQLTFLFSFCCFLAFANTVDSIDLETYLRQNNIQAHSLKDGLYYNFDEEGSGAVPKAGDYLVVNYVGKLVDGTVFDESRR